MATSNAAFTKKLRLAIKAKINELGVDADDELPDYVMVLAANKKDKKLMRDDLNIFLGKSTTTFVDWLFDAFERIQKGVGAAKQPEPEKKLSDSIKSLPSEEGDAMSKFNRGKNHRVEEEHEEDKKKKKAKKKKSKKEESPEGFMNTFEQIQSPKRTKHKKHTVEESPTPPHQHKHHDKEKKHKKKKRTPSPIYNEEKKTLKYDVISDAEDEVQILPREENAEQQERPKFKQRLQSQVGLVINSNTGSEFSENHHRKHEKHHRKERDSKVHVSKNAIFKRAVSSAKLVVNVDSITSKADNSQTKVLVETKETACQADSPDPTIHHGTEKEEQKPVKTVRKRRADDPLRTVARLMGMELNKVKKKPVEVPEVVEEEKKDIAISTEEGSSGTVSKTPSFSGWNGQITLGETSSSSDEGEEAEIDALVASAIQERQVLGSQLPPTAALSRPQLYASQQETIQTLLKQSVITHTQITQQQVSVAAQPSPVIPVNERCRFWPNCTKGPTCPYIHPTQTCSKFPGCFYGNKCVYIHPLCKYGISCTRPNCPYTHIEASVTTPTKVPPPPPKSTIMCKFKGRCENPGCEFKHPPPCIYGMACRTYGCTFLHRKPDLSKFKWSKT
ncbi:unnamed protein product [Bursaphelenchus okinawaensis]|uniref:Zinc finger CCCH domain-containing protein 14 n=1 Tax=Bursaphelenchus okinawaensis TaxID=465554 RepID=A0A811L9D6_9BILA|nr:unnamed protein product [Bursaphelenchus okinawaensis]CAG9120241.1 unnamed protein product [Bursaphelenchus okinawaensis]